MNEKIKKIIKSFLVVIIAGFIVSFLYIGLANREIKKETIKLPEISSYDYDYYDLESRISDLESKVEDLDDSIDEIEYRVDDIESKTDENESDIGGLENRIGDLEWELGY